MLINLGFTNKEFYEKRLDIIFSEALLNADKKEKAKS